MAANKTILVTGANGQLGRELRELEAVYPQYHFLFADKEELPVENAAAIKNYFTVNTIHYCINCAAYTAVDKAENEKGAAFLINATAVGNLAAACQTFKVQLIHISTDYVFDGTAKQPYKETDLINPVNFYGQSKLKGEALALQNNPAAIIVRTSWVYSRFANNFVKTMLRLMKERGSITVVNDQFGCPTYAADLANAIMQIINTSSIPNFSARIFNYCNEGVITWYDFAVAIKELSGSNCIVNPIPSSQYPTPAKRPQYSVLDTTSIKDTFNVQIPGWKESLEKCLLLLK